jgi:DNA-binding NarL/FixJ family response regulator
LIVATSTVGLDALPSDARSYAVSLIATSEVTARRVQAALASDDLPAATPTDGPDGVSTHDESRHAVIFDLGDHEEAPALVRDLRNRMRDIVILAIAPESEKKRAKELLRTGASAVVFENRIESSLACTLRSAWAGQVIMPAELYPQTQRYPLSSREKQVLGLVVMGFTNGEIASKLYLAESTVKSHLSSSFNKLGVRSRSEATALILDPSEGLGVGILTLPTNGA